MKRYYKEINGMKVMFEGILIHDGFQVINPTDEMMEAEGWLEYTDPEPTQDEQLQDAIETKLAQIDEYDKSTSVNSFTLGGVTLWLDAQLRQQLRTSIDAYKAMNKETATKWFNGQEYTFPVDTWLQMLNALEVYAAEALNVTEAHKAEVAELETVDEVEEYDITADYPQKLVFGA